MTVDQWTVHPTERDLLATAEPRRIPPAAFDHDTLEARTVRAEAAAEAAIARARELEIALWAVDHALLLERVPNDGLTRFGRVRWLGDQRRRAERA